MSREFDNVLKEINKNHKELYQADSKVSREINSVQKDLDALKRDIKSLNNKVDLLLDILNNLTIMVLDEEEISELDDQDEFDSNEGWLPENDDWDNYEEDK